MRDTTQVGAIARVRRGIEAIDASGRPIGRVAHVPERTVVTDVPGRDRHGGRPVTAPLGRG
jgi:hypothetical protein